MFTKLKKIKNRIKKIAESQNKLFYYGRFLPSSRSNTNIMFIGERPTKPKNKRRWNPENNFNLSLSDKNFIKILKKHGFNGSYITDIVKSVAPAGSKLTKKSLKYYSPFLIEEIKIIKPKILIALGKEAEKILKNMNIHMPILWIYHPAYVQRYSKKDEFEKQVKELSLLIYNLNPKILFKI